MVVEDNREIRLYLSQSLSENYQVYEASNGKEALTGESVKEFIRRIRLNTAAEMILRNEHSIAEISFLVGFATPSYFTTSFKKYFGCLPTEYIKKQTEGETEEEEREEN